MKKILLTIFTIILSTTPVTPVAHAQSSNIFGLSSNATQEGNTRPTLTGVNSQYLGLDANNGYVESIAKQSRIEASNKVKRHEYITRQAAERLEALGYSQKAQELLATIPTGYDKIQTTTSLAKVIFLTKPAPDNPLELPAHNKAVEQIQQDVDSNPFTWWTGLGY